MTEPVSSGAARFPPAYGQPGGSAELLPWSFVEERLRAAPNYWLTTVSPSGRPHARPVDGVWVDGVLCFGGSPDTVWVRNLTANPALSAHLASYTEAIIVEGTAELVTNPDDPLAAPSTAASREKYPQYVSAQTPPFRPFWVLRPRTIYAWTLDSFPRSAARWRFDAAADRG